MELLNETRPQAVTTDPGPDAQPPPHGDGRFERRRWLALSVLLAATAMDLMGTTVATIALPAIQDDLRASDAALEWTIAGYSLAFAVALITGGRLGDVFGRRRVFLIGLGGFTVASAMCGVVPDPSMLVTARVTQGLFAALMVPQVLSIISTSFVGVDRTKAFGMFGATAGVAAVAGPLLSGALIELDLLGLGWRPIFLMNVPIGVCVLVAVRALVDESRTEQRPKLDLLGAFLMTGALLLLLLPLIEGRTLGWPAWTIAAMFASVPAIAAFAAQQRGRERRAASPLVPPTLFAQPAFSYGMLATVTFFSGPPALLFVTTLALQGLGFSAMRTALTFVPLSLASIPAAGASVVLAPSLGRRLTVGGALLVVLGTSGLLVAVGLAGPGMTTWTLMPGMVVTGLGLGLVAPTLIDVVLAEVAPRDAGAASGALNTAMQLGASTGVALVGVAFFGALPVTPSPMTDPAQGYANAMTSGLWLVAGLAALSALSMRLLPGPSGTESDHA